MWIAIFETPRVDIRAYGSTRSDAKKAIRRLWKLACYREHYDPDHISKYWDEVTFEEIVPGTGCIDGIEMGILSEIRLPMGYTTYSLSEVTDEQLRRNIPEAWG